MMIYPFIYFNIIYWKKNSELKKKIFHNVDYRNPLVMTFMVVTDRLYIISAIRERGIGAFILKIPHEFEIFFVLILLYYTLQDIQECFK